MRTLSTGLWTRCARRMCITTQQNVTACSASRYTPKRPSGGLRLLPAYSWHTVKISVVARQQGQASSPDMDHCQGILEIEKGVGGKDVKRLLKTAFVGKFESRHRQQGLQT